MSLHCHWRGSEEFCHLGLKFSTTSNEAVKLYDASLTQYVGWYDEPSVGGLETSCRKLMETDPSWVMSHVLHNGLELMGTGRTTRLDMELRACVDKMVALANYPKVTNTEKEHVKAVKLLADGHMDLACDIWDDILMENPLDMLAIKLAHDSHFYLGYQPRMRDTIARVFPYWSADIPLYSYLLGMHSFGLCETNFYAEAEKMSRKGLELNPRDAWSTHSLAHVLEMTGRAKEGIAFLSTTMQNWTVS